MTQDEIDSEIERYEEAMNQAKLILGNPNDYDDFIVESSKNVVSFCMERIRELQDILSDEELKELEADSYFADEYDREQDELEYSADLEDYDIY